MGPPPPPPPPPLLQPSATLPSRKWKTEDASRRVNNPVPSAPKPTRPTVDAAALQHAAARLRKTGYNESLRGDVTNLPNGGMDRSDQRVSDGDRTHRAQLQQLERDSARETVHATPANPHQSSPLGDIHRHTVPLNSYATIREAPSNHSNYSSINKFTSSTLNQYQDTEPSYISPYSSKYSYPTNFRSYHKDDDYFENTCTPNNNNYEKSSSEAIPESNTPVIRNAREMIRDYSTTNYVYDESPSSFNDQVERVKARNFVQNSLAKQLRDEGLTESQKFANRYQKAGNATSSSLPFDVSKIVKDAYKGDEVDHLVHQMKNNLHSTSPTSVLQYPRDPHSSETRTISNFSTHTTERKIMNINICVACGKEVTADLPGCDAMGKIFHVDCFRCGNCQKTLAGSSFYNINDKPTCENCYQESLEKCSSCHQSISDKLLRACGGVYHVNCFVCYSCKKSLDGIPFTLDKENNVHCVPCFHDKFAPRCAVCSRPIVPQDGEKESVRVVAMDKSFHVDCYKCEDCGMQLSSKLDGQGCYPIDQHLLCKTCNGNRLRVQSST